MRKKLFILAFLSLLIPASSFLFPVHAQDAPNTNITKRRPDRPPAYSPSPTPAATPAPAAVKQVETGNQSFLAKLWDQVRSFFINLFKQPEASSTSAN